MAGLWGNKPKHARPTAEETTEQRETKRGLWGTATPKPKNRRKATKPDPNRWDPRW